MKRADIERSKPRPSGGPSWIHHGKKMGGALVGVFLRAGLADDRLALDEDLHGEATILADEYALHLAPGPKDPKDQRFLQLAREVFTMLMDPTGLPTTAADRRGLSCIAGFGVVSRSRRQR